VEFRSDARKLTDPGLDAQVHAALDELAGIVDYTVLRADDGTFTVLLGGQTPLVMGEHLYPVTADLSTGQPALLDAAGGDITGQIGGGKLRALIEYRRDVLNGLMADLNFLAEQVSDGINLQLQAGVDLNGQPPCDLFTYDPQAGSAMTLRVTDIAPEELAAATPWLPAETETH
jgi:flagellar hook-associated protein FlgK